MKRLLLFMLAGLFLLSFASSAEYFFEKDQAVDVKVVCYNEGYCSGTSFCNMSVLYPNNTAVVDNVQMTNQDSFHNYTLTAEQVNLAGIYPVSGFCNDTDDTQKIDFYFEVNSNGEKVQDGSGFVYVGLILLIFLVACFFLYLSSQMGENAFQIFFLMMAFIFLTTSFFISYFAVVNMGLGDGMQSLTTTLIIIMLSLLFIMFLYVLIRQTINALDMLKVKKGLKIDNNVGSGSKVGGYNTRRAY